MEVNDLPKTPNGGQILMKTDNEVYHCSLDATQAKKSI